MSKKITYCPEKTMHMIEEDKALGYIYGDLTKVIGSPERYAIRYIFTSYIQGDPHREPRYREDEK